MRLIAVPDRFDDPRSERAILAAKVRERRRGMALGLLFGPALLAIRAARQAPDPLAARRAARRAAAESLANGSLVYLLYEGLTTRYRGGLSDSPAPGGLGSVFGPIALHDEANFALATISVSLARQYRHTRSLRATARQAGLLGVGYGLMFAVLLGTQRISDHWLRQRIDRYEAESETRFADDLAADEHLFFEDVTAH